jgi:hypothetical protein
MANFWGGWTPPRHSGTWVGARVASLRCHYPPPRRSQHSRNAKARPHKSKTSCLGGHRRGTTTSGPGRGPLAGFEVTLYGRFWGDRRGYIAIPLLEKATLVDDDDLQKMWASLLANASHPERASTVSQGFPTMLAGLSPRQAKFLEVYFDARVYSIFVKIRPIEGCATRKWWNGWFPFLGPMSVRI